MPRAAPQGPATGCSGESRPSRIDGYRFQAVFGRAAPLSRNPKPPSATENHLEHELAAGVGKHQQRGSGNDPIERRAAAPAVTMPADKQRPEYEPAQQREH